jgi:hypothetical protein
MLALLMLTVTAISDTSAGPWTGGLAQDQHARDSTQDVVNDKGDATMKLSGVRRRTLLASSAAASSPPAAESTPASIPTSSAAEVRTLHCLDVHH